MADLLESTPASGRRRRRRWYPWLTVPAALMATVLAVLPHLRLVQPWLVPSVQALVPVVAVACLVVAVLLVLVRRRAPAVLLLAGALAGLAPALVPWPMAADEPASSTGGQLTVLSLNVQYGRADREAVVDAVATRDVEVLVLLEADEALLEDLAALGLTEALPYRTEPISSGGSSSRVPDSISCRSVGSLQSEPQIRSAWVIMPRSILPPPLAQDSISRPGWAALRSSISR